ncbi:MAG: hypothetical protein JO181_16000 [Solirubrobacterales bacterium]|nr:hypothetical protein [Solirubrobacterales bacterium]
MSSPLIAPVVRGKRMGLARLVVARRGSVSAGAASVAAGRGWLASVAMTLRYAEVLA